MGHITAIVVVAMVFGAIVAVCLGPIWLHYRYGGKAAGVHPRESVTRLDELTEVAERMQQRIDALERLLDASTPEWRNKP